MLSQQQNSLALKATRIIAWAMHPKIPHKGRQADKPKSQPSKGPTNTFEPVVPTG
jgi:hypothetical protein